MFHAAAELDLLLMHSLTIQKLQNVATLERNLINDVLCSISK